MYLHLYILLQPLLQHLISPFQRYVTTSAVASKKDVSIDTPFSVMLPLTFHNSRSDTLGRILTGPNASEIYSDSLGPVRMGTSVSEGEL